MSVLSDVSDQSDSSDLSDDYKITRGRRYRLGALYAARPNESKWFHVRYLQSALTVLKSGPVLKSAPYVELRIFNTDKSVLFSLDMIPPFMI